MDGARSELIERRLHLPVSSAWSSRLQPPANWRVSAQILSGSVTDHDRAEGGGIFVSYRRQETSHVAGRLYDRLADRFGEGQVFIDVDTIEPGVDFAEEIFRAGGLPGAAGDHRPGLADRSRRARPSAAG